MEQKAGKALTFYSYGIGNSGTRNRFVSFKARHCLSHEQNTEREFIAFALSWLPGLEVGKERYLFQVFFFFGDNNNRKK